MKKPKVLKDKYEINPLEKRVVLELRSGVPIILGRIGPEVRKIEEFIALRHAILGDIYASLIRVTPKVIWYRQVLKDAATNDSGGQVQFNPEQQ